MQKEGKIDKSKLLKQTSSCIYFFGYKYQMQKNKQTPFSQVQYRGNENNQELMITLKAQNQRLEFQLQNIKSLLTKIVRPKHENFKEKTIDELLEQLFEIILQKCQQISQLKKKNENLKEQIQNLLKKSNPQISSSMVKSNSRNYLHLFPTTAENRPSQIELQYSKVTKKNSKVRQDAYRRSQQSNKTCSMYRPRVLFQIGKEVNTVNQISSQNVLRKQQAEISYQIGTNSQNSFKGIQKIKSYQNRMSIQGSIYTESQDEVQRVNIYSNFKTQEKDIDEISESSIERDGQRGQLFQIQQLQNGQSSISIQLKGLAKLPKRRQFANQGNNIISNNRASLKF